MDQEERRERVVVSFLLFIPRMIMLLLGLFLLGFYNLVLLTSVLLRIIAGFFTLMVSVVFIGMIVKGETEHLFGMAIGLILCVVASLIISIAPGLLKFISDELISRGGRIRG